MKKIKKEKNVEAAMYKIYEIYDIGRRNGTIGSHDNPHLINIIFNLLTRLGYTHVRTKIRGEWTTIVIKDEKFQYGFGGWYSEGFENK